MKKLLTLGLVLLAVSGLALAQAAPAATAAPAAKPVKAAPVKLHEFTGIVTAVDVVGNTITVKKPKAEETFSVTPDTKIKLRKEYKLAEVPKDSKVFIKYKEDAGSKVAVSILIQKLGKPAKPAK
ncbi:MAG TPA: hypothetical protein VMF29_01595 [Candidatus Edwardsbacteria bacterium]|nr:hypothetical protein [Candidatus Edwardsbacteria bacterium]